MTKAQVIQQSNQQLSKLMAKFDLADIVASGYETICPKCGEFCELIEVPGGTEAVKCPACKTLFLTALPEHAVS